MPDWLQSIIRGDAAKAVGIEWSEAEKARLDAVLRAKGERHDRKFDKITFKGEYDMKHKENVLEALKSGAMTVEQLVEKTGISTNVLYTVVSDLANQGKINKESIDGGRQRRYSLITAENPRVERAPTFEVAPKKVRTLATKQISAPTVLGMFKPGNKFQIQRAGTAFTVLFTTEGFFNLTTGQPVVITPEEGAHAMPIMNLKAEVLQQVSI